MIAGAGEGAAHRRPNPEASDKWEIGEHLNWTLWRPKNGSPDQISLSIETGSGSHRVNTGGRGEQSGGGTVTLTPSGAGGRFEFKGKDLAGNRLEVAIICPAFAGVEAEGG